MFGEWGEIKNLHLNLDRRTGYVKVSGFYSSHVDVRKGMASKEYQDVRHCGCKHGRHSMLEYLMQMNVLLTVS
jgi:hypothetical protein